MKALIVSHSFGVLLAGLLSIAGFVMFGVKYFQMFASIHVGLLLISVVMAAFVYIFRVRSILSLLNEIITPTHLFGAIGLHFAFLPSGLFRQLGFGVGMVVTMFLFLGWWRSAKKEYHVAEKVFLESESRLSEGLRPDELYKEVIESGRPHNSVFSELIGFLLRPVGSVLLLVSLFFLVVYIGETLIQVIVAILMFTVLQLVVVSQLHYIVVYFHLLQRLSSWRSPVYFNSVICMQQGNISAVHQPSVPSSAPTEQK